jgi:hypothetical protein
LHGPSAKSFAREQTVRLFFGHFIIGAGNGQHETLAEQRSYVLEGRLAFLERPCLVSTP